MRRKIRIVLSLIIVIIAIFGYAHISKTHAIYDRTIDPSEYGSVTANPDTILEQSFVSEENYLDGIRIKGSENGDISQVYIHYTLREMSTQKQVAEGEINAKEALSRQFYELPFQRIEGCNGEAYILQVEQYTNDQESSVSFMYERKAEENTNMLVDEEEIDGTVVMKTVTKRFDLETFFVVLVFAVYIMFFIRLLYRLFK